MMNDTRCGYGDGMRVFPSESEISGPLLDFLRDTLGAQSYAESPTPMTPGNDTQVYALQVEGTEQPLVLRVFRRGSDPRRPAFEATLQNALADEGLPVPRARAVSSDPSVIGAPFFVMDRVAGTPLYAEAISIDDAGIPQADWAQLLRQGSNLLFDMPRVLAEVCLRIQEIGAKPIVSAFEEAGLRWQELTVEGRIRLFTDRVEQHALDGLRPAIDWLADYQPVADGHDVVCHCDVQPLNLMMSGKELCGILDWANGSLGPPELEIGWTRAMFLTISLPLPAPLRFLERSIAGLIATRYTRIYERSRPVDRDAIAYYEALRSLIGLSILGEYIAKGETIRDAWNSPTAVTRLVSHVRDRTGLEVSIPWPA
jgi:aminoglycoside phosphotransferase (APT) family kinase protein